MLNVEIVTPEKLVANVPCYMATIPAEAGEMGVLAKHAPQVSNLSEGEVKIFKDDHGSPFATYKIKGGFVEISSDTCRILADSVED